MNKNNDSNSASNSDIKSAITFVIKILACLDVAWALLIACYYSFIVHSIAQVGNVSASALDFGTVISFVLAFLVALFQGAIFLVVISVFAFVIMTMYKFFKSN